ncbi:MAG: FAD-dependent oxidoreductase [Burkholderiales bacterium]|jgi:electron transfer flavoprotein-quinone oxidoreductase|nr:FAD-dependent oxidoreductase [Burkholderiales bacterium]
MVEEKWDAIIVGAGVAGSVAALLLARANARVLLVERGHQAGSKNMSGGRVYTHGLKRIFPHFSEMLPVERRVAHEKISLLTPDRMTTFDYRSTQPETDNASYTVLRASFDHALAKEAESAGATVLTGARVDDVLTREGKVSGISIEGETLLSDVVILADGVNSLLGERLKMTQKLTPQKTALGVKTVIELPQNLIEERFQLSDNEGCAWLFAGAVTSGLVGGGFLYTNKASLSLGVVCHLDQLNEHNQSVPEMLDAFSRHALIAPLIRGGRVGEYSAHLVSESGIHGVASKLFDDGVLIIGDAAGFCLNLGYTVRGMDLAIASAEMAAQTVLSAKARQDFSAHALSSYRTLIGESFVGKDMTTYRRCPALLKTPRFFKDYPELAANLLEDIFTVKSQPVEPLLKRGIRHCESIGLATLAKDIIKAARSF